MANIDVFYEKVQDILRRGIPHVVVTMVEVKGSAPQDVGAKIVVSEEGIVWGTVGGGKVEAQVIREAQEMLNDVDASNHRFVRWNLQRDIKMTCGGEVCFFFERFLVDVWNICVFGAGHVAQALVPLLCQLNCRVHCIDPRSEWLSKIAKRDNLHLYCIEEPRLAVQHIPKGAFIALMTKGHSTDVPILEEIFGMHEPTYHFPYLGMIGSDTKAFRVKKQLEQAGFLESQIAQIRSPIGLRIGSNDPIEIAISIVAEMIQVRR